LAIFNKLLFPLLATILLLVHIRTDAQIANTLNSDGQPANPFLTDTTNGKNKMGNKWIDEQARINYHYLNSLVKHYPDTSLRKFHHYQPVQPWWGRDMGNIASPTFNMFYTPDQVIGPQLGYHIWDMQMITLDSLPFYNTTRPYSSFQFQLGSKTEQKAEILHTQNINPDWNFAFHFRNINSPGYFRFHQTTSNCGSFNTGYASRDQKYQMALAFIYNKFNQDENGGIVRESDLTDPSLTNRELIEVNLPGRGGSTYSRRSAVTNIYRTWDLYLQNSYAWGKADTLYNEDSTAATYRFTPRFRVKHQLQLHSEKHTFRDSEPDSARYAFLGIASRFAPNDTLESIQSWFYIENRFSLNGYLGKGEALALVEAGIANRIDNFSTDYRTDVNKSTTVSNYLFGQIRKEAQEEGQWSYEAAARFFFTGTAAGDFDINASAGKDLKTLGRLSAGFKQTLSNAPYAWEYFQSNFYNRNFSFNKPSVTKLWGDIAIDRLRLSFGARNYLMANYLYYDDTFTPQQQSEAFSVLQVYGRKQFVYRSFSLDNEVIWQQPTANAPVNLPAFMLRHILSVETNLFKNALKAAVGLEARYHTPYFANGYTPYFNQFYLQDAIRVSNPVECTAFFNFKVRNFRCFVSGDQLQQLVIKKNVINAPGYPAQNALFRFGFNWVMIN